MNIPDNSIYTLPLQTDHYYIVPSGVPSYFHFEKSDFHITEVSIST